MPDLQIDSSRAAVKLRSSLSRRHILPHAEGHQGMFGMVNALIVQP